MGRLMGFIVQIKGGGGGVREGVLSESFLKRKLVVIRQISRKS